MKDSAVRSRLIKSGQESLYDILGSRFSEATHATAWGSQCYLPQSPDDPDAFFLDYSPTYDPMRVFLLATVLVSTLPNLIGYFIETGLAELSAITPSFDLLKSRQGLLLSVYNMEAPKWMVVLGRYREAQQKLSAGQPFEEVYATDKLSMELSAEEAELLRQAY